MVSMKLAAVHSPTSAPNHSSGPVRAVEHFAGSARARSSATSGGSSARIVDDGQRAVLGLAEQMGDRGGEDEEREQRQQRQIGEVAGVDEAVVIDADRDPLDHFPRRRRAA